MEESSMDDFFDPGLQAFFDSPFFGDDVEEVSDIPVGASLNFWDAVPVVPIDGFDKDPIDEVVAQDSFKIGGDEPSDENSLDSPGVLSSSSQARLRSSSPTPPTSTIQVQIPFSTLSAPRSYYEPFEPGFPIKSEYKAIQELLPLARDQDKSGGDYLELQLDEFAVYDETVYYGLQMRSLHQLDIKERGSQFYFDGVLRSGNQAIFVKRVPIQAMPIQDYGMPAKQHTVRDSIWLETPLSGQNNLYYRLGKPAFEYSRFFKPFLWVADLAKHFVDYLDGMWQRKRRVSIHDFRANFYNWVLQSHGDAKEVQKWLSMHPSTDYRTSIIANIDFLYKEAIGVLDQKDTFVHLLWKDLSWENAKFQRYKEPPQDLYSPLDLSRTVVTPYIFDCFKHLPFGDRLDAVPFSDKTQTLREKLIQDLSFPGGSKDARPALSDTTKDRIRNICPGDTISTHRDTAESGSKWQRELSKDFSDVDRWFARVQQVDVDKRGKRCFDVSWYYRPVDTLCGLMKYPWKNELFLSDHCSCEERYKITEDEVLGVHDVDFNGNPSTSCEFFCRQAYIHQDRKWVSLEEKHLVCEHTCDRAEGSTYRPGDTVLVRLDESDRSQPCEVLSIADAKNRQGRLQRTLTLRKLLRRSKVDSKAQAVRPNELVYSEETVIVDEEKVMGRCHVRFFPVGSPISCPYDRNGVGHLFVLSYKTASSSYSTIIEPLTKCPETLRQGFDPVLELPQLRGLDLFSGGGNFGRGLEEAGGIKMHWANDYVSNAIHTYMANVKSPEDVHPFLGSIDILQKLALKGNFSKNVPAPGEVDFISGGSPCPGFSALTNDKTTVAQRKNQSLVAAFASAIDLYRPKYGLLENVTGIVQKKANRDQDVFSQLICAVVGLGYQTQFYFLDASSCGSPQRRARVFLAFAAPRYKLPDKPQPTHSHPDYTHQLALGKLPNGEAMAEREWPEATPFKFTSAEEATADLPPIQDGKPDICVPFPDHRVSIGQTKRLLLQMSHIPNRPFGMNFASTWYRDVPLMTKSERECFPSDNNATVLRVGPKSNAFGRQRPDSLLGTVVTRQSPGDGKSGRQIHWHENRALTIMEARRAQGFRDEDVLLGTPAEQYRIVGNSVAREVAVALGIAFREAYASSTPTDPVDPKEVPIVLVNSDTDMDSGTETTSRVFSSTRENSRSETPLTSASEVNTLLPAGSGPVAPQKRKRNTLSASIVRSSKITRIIMGGDTSGI